jgi:CMP-N,N'-diacetyllegionaminic acid synthase
LTSKLRVLGLVPARGGSKGVPRKNIRMLAGKPLLAYTAEAAARATRLSRVVLSTEDAEIAAVGRAFGLEAPFVRPSELAADDTPTIPVVLHALDALRSAGDEFDAVCLLQPTNPLRTAGDIDACIELMESTGADSVISVLPVPHQYNPHWVYLRQTGGGLELALGDTARPIPRRQALPPAFHRDGSLYVVRTGVVRGGSLFGKSVMGYEIDPALSHGIDTWEDWARLERLIAAKAPDKG